MRLNLLALTANLLALAAVLALRVDALPGGLGTLLGSLPWESFGSELRDLPSASQVSAGALLAAWLSASLGWVLVSLLVMALPGRQPAQATLSPAPVDAPAVAVMRDEAPAADTETEPELSTARPAPARTQQSAADIQLQTPTLTVSARTPDLHVAADLQQFASRLPPAIQADLQRLEQALDRLSRS